MKKLLSFLFITSMLPAWSLCPVDSNESVCSSSISGSSVLPLFQNQNAAGINSESNKKTSSDSSKPLGLNSSFSKTQNQDGVHMQGSLGCQFGNCKKGANNDFLENQ